MAYRKIQGILYFVLFFLTGCQSTDLQPVSSANSAYPSCAIGKINNPIAKTNFLDPAIITATDFPQNEIKFSEYQTKKSDSGILINSDQMTPKSYVSFEVWDAGDTVAIRLNNNGAFQIALLPTAGIGDSWNFAMDYIIYDLILDINNTNSPNAILFINQMGEKKTLGEFEVPEGEIIFVFKPQQDFSVYDVQGKRLQRIEFPDEWGIPACIQSDCLLGWSTWLIGDPWADFLLTKQLTVYDVCIK